MHDSGAIRAAGMRRCVNNAPHSRSSSPGLTGRPSIPPEPENKSRGRGVLDRPVKPDDDNFLWSGRAILSVALRTQGPITVVRWSRRRWPPCQNARSRRMGPCVRRDDIEIMHSRDPLARN